MNNGGYGDVDLTLDESVLGFDARELKRRLKEGSPRMVYDGSTVRTRQLRSGEEQLVATRLREVLAGAA